MAAAAAGLASMAHLTATSTWLVLLPGFILAGIGLGITSTGLASAALAAVVEPARAGMAAKPGEHAAPGRHRHRRGRARRPLRLPHHHRHPARPGEACPPRPAPPTGWPPPLAPLVHAADPGSHRGPARRPRRGHPRRPRLSTASGLNDVLLAAARLRRARRDSRLRIRTRPSQAAAAQPRPRRPQRAGRPAGHRPAPTTGRAQNNATIAPSRRRRRPAGSPQVSIPGLPPRGPRSRSPTPTGYAAPKRPGVDSSPDRASPGPIVRRCRGRP